MSTGVSRASSRVEGSLRTYVLDSTMIREGGQALVYRAKAEGVTYAVKLARKAGPHLARERDALLKLQKRSPDSPDWMVQIVDYGTVDGRDFIVLPWYPCSLDEWLESGPSLGRVLLALERAAEAVARLHRAADLREQYLHRDIKPGNFLVDDSDGLKVVLADLGGVKDGRLLDSTRLDGLHSPGFAPAEQALPLSQRPDASLDAHGLAATVYYGLAGRLPDSKLVPVKFPPAARQLFFLHLMGPKKRDDDEEVEYQRLSKLPAEAFLDLPDMDALTEADVARLRNRIRDAKGDMSQKTAVNWEGQLDVLVEQLRAALAPDPRVRSKEVRGLYSALIGLRECLEGSEGPVFPVLRGEGATLNPADVHSEVPTSPPRRPLPVPPPPANPPPTQLPSQEDLRPAGTGLWLGLATLGALAAVGLGSFGVWWATRPAELMAEAAAVEDAPVGPVTDAAPAATAGSPPDSLSGEDVPALAKPVAVSPTAPSQPKPAVVKPTASLAAPVQTEAVVATPVVAETEREEVAADPAKPAPGDGLKLRVTNQKANSFPELLLRVDGVAKGTFTDFKVVSLEDGDHVVFASDERDGEAIKACVWRIAVSSTVTTDRMVLDGVASEKPHGETFSVACK